MSAGKYSPTINKEALQEEDLDETLYQVTHPDGTYHDVYPGDDDFPDDERYPHA